MNYCTLFTPHHLAMVHDWLESPEVFLCVLSVPSVAAVATRTRYGRWAICELCSRERPIKRSRFSYSRRLPSRTRSYIEPSTAIGFTAMLTVFFTLASIRIAADMSPMSSIPHDMRPAFRSGEHRANKGAAPSAGGRRLLAILTPRAARVGELCRTGILDHGFHGFRGCFYPCPSEESVVNLHAPWQRRRSLRVRRFWPQSFA